MTQHLPDPTQRVIKTRTGGEVTSLVRSHSALGAAHLGFQVFQAGAGLLIAVLLVRLLGPSDYGVYTLALAVTTTVTLPTQVTLNGMLVRYTAAYASNANWELLAGLLFRLKIIIAVAFISAAGLVAGYLLYFPRSSWSPLALTGLLAGVLIPVIALASTRRAFLTGLDRPLLAQSLETALRALFCIALAVCVTSGLSLNPAWAMGLHLVAAMAAALIGAWFISAVAPPQLRAANPEYANASWMRSSIPLVAAGATQALLTQADLLTLGWFGTTADAGNYRAAVQIATLATFPAIATSAVIAPTFARLNEADDFQALKRLFRLVASFVGAAAFVVVAACFVIGDDILHLLYGEQFREAQSVLVAASIAQAFNALGIISLMAQSMTGNEGRVFRAGIVGAIANLALAVVLIPSAGAIGAAMASTGGYVLSFAVLCRLRSSRTTSSAGGQKIDEPSIPPGEAPRLQPAQRPNFFVVGAPKCGTTSLAAWLAEHPLIYMSPNKEPEYFNHDITLSAERSLAAYERLFHGVTPSHRVVGEASVLYLYSEVAIQNILAYSPRSKFIVAIRNPVEMAISLHNQELFNGNENVLDFREAWMLQEPRAAGRFVPRACSDAKLLQYGAICSIGAQLQRLLRLAPKDDVFVVALEDLRADPAHHYAAVLAFLGVEPDDRVHFPVHNVARKRRSRTVHIAIKSGRSLWKRAAYSRAGRAALGFYNFLNSIESRPPAVAPDVLADLQEYFEPDIQLLERLTGRTFPQWRRYRQKGLVRSSARP